jgi:DNA recombination protein Rad52
MAFSDAQTRLLSGKLSEKHIRTREQRGMKLSYIEGWHVIAEANRVFGFDGWDREAVLAECIWQDARREPKACAYAVRVRIRVRAGDTIVCREGSGVGHGVGATLGEAHESALKEAETDATKRALVTFGNVFGLALYDKQQGGVRRRATRTGAATPAGLSWAALSAAGELLSRHDLPEDFCGGMREHLAAATEIDALQSFWARNAATLAHLRAVCPELRTVNGTHYADVLEKLYEHHLGRLKTAPGSPAPLPTVIDKSELIIAAPKRLRDRDHLQFVASLPCLICGRTPSQAHHLRFAQPRSMGSKVSDEFTVPLCLLHHRALHDVGSEEKWWVEQGIDAKAEAGRLWQGRASGSPSDGVPRQSAAE